MVQAQAVARSSNVDDSTASGLVQVTADFDGGVTTEFFVGFGS
jgi:hypothetical protein